ncbi:hypothetical protein SACE_3125 [Saccharopolyspora erythraea NRRL 2338]|uniref:TIGR03084 family protein n=2 Tax=Saccharopolyspora erythraea TaxID=1836 RepID=A4FEC8_SACEN|nr:wyosine base formation [Saccharopolyspora erythraea D]CAM02403.1 hypothetical protein SACE_3125 [Saccharopolyspora erythraea NRRL 2338]
MLLVLRRCHDERMHSGERRERDSSGSGLTERLLVDLRAETAELDALVAGLDPAGWRRATPAPGWTIAHQIAHLAWTDEQAVLAVRDPEAFQAALENAAELMREVDDAAARGVREDPAALLARWRTGHAELAVLLAACPDGTRLPWFGPPMGVPSMVTARLMETWAHGQDVADALGVRREPTDRLRHIAMLGVRTRDFAYAVNGIRPPTEEFRVELTGPDGQRWCWGPEDAEQVVRGPALDFCLVVTQRRHPAGTALTAVGEQARHWLGIAQAFAGPPGPGREAAGSPDAGVQPGA